VITYENFANRIENASKNAKGEVVDSRAREIINNSTECVTMTHDNY
jgi:hypothetical protein